MRLDEIINIKFPEFFVQGIIELREREDKSLEIYVWNVPNVPTPTEDDIATWTKECDLPFRQKMATASRKYPSVGDQLDMLYKDIKNGTKTFVQAIDFVKNHPPKPTE